MNPFEEFNFGDKYILRFYRVDHGLVCTINESMVPELHEVVKEINQQQLRIEQLEKTQDYLYKTHDADKEEKKALYNLVTEQDKKIIDLAFKEANTRSRP